MSLFGNDNDDDDLLGATVRGSSSAANLSDIFSDTLQAPENSNLLSKRLKYTAPNQPKKFDQAPLGNGSSSESLATTSAGAGGSGVTSSLYADMVTAYQLRSDKSYANQGKLGAALIQTLLQDGVKLIKLLLYTLKPKIQLAACTIKENSIFAVLPNNYISFNDDVSTTWSITFDSQDKLTHLLSQIFAIKLQLYGNSSASSSTELITQDLNHISLQEHSVSGDEDLNLQLRYRLFSVGEKTLNDYSLLSPETSLIRINTSSAAESVKKSVSGLRLGGKRLVALNHDLAKELTADIPSITSHSNFTLALELELVIMEKIESIRPKTPETLPAGPSSASSSTQPLSTSSATSLKDRMAKLGAATPIISHQIQTAKPSEPLVPNGGIENFNGDSDTDSCHGSRQDLTQEVPIQQRQQYKPRIVDGFGSQNALNTSSSVISSHVGDLLLAENRAHTAELKLHFVELDRKVDLLLSKVDSSDSASGRSSSAGIASASCSSAIGSGSGLFDPKIVVGSIQAIMSENTKLKNELDAKNEQLARYNEKICDMLVEHESRASTSSTSSHDLIRAREKIQELESRLRETTLKNQRYQEQVSVLRSENLNLSQRVGGMDVVGNLSGPGGQRIPNGHASNGHSHSSGTPVQFMELRNCIRKVMKHLYGTLEGELKDNTDVRPETTLPTVARVIRQVTDELMKSPTQVWQGGVIGVPPPSPGLRAPPPGGFDEIDREHPTSSMQPADGPAQQQAQPASTTLTSVESTDELDNHNKETNPEYNSGSESD